MRLVAVTIIVALLAGPGTAIAGQAPAAPAATGTDVYLHTVVPGDTLTGLGMALLTRPLDWPVIQRLNRVRNPRRLRPGSSLRIPVDLLRLLPGRADVDWVKGRVHVEDGSGPRRLALAGAQLAPGAAIETEAEAAIRLRLSGGAVVTVGAETSLTLVELRELPTAGTTRTHIDLQRGRLEHDVPPSSRPGHRYEISTPVVTTAVRGTGFRVGVAPAAAGTPARGARGNLPGVRDRVADGRTGGRLRTRAERVAAAGPADGRRPDAHLHTRPGQPLHGGAAGADRLT